MSNLTDGALPYGHYARLILFWTVREACQRNADPNLDADLARMIPMQGGAHRILHEMGVLKPSQRGGGTQYAALTRQLKRIVNTNIHVRYDMASEFGHGRLTSQTPLVSRSFLWWQNDDTSGDMSTTSHITLSHEFFDDVVTHAVPLSSVHVAKLHRSSMALDVYAWAAHRLHTHSGDTRVTWEQLKGQIGTSYPDTARGLRNFRGKVRKAISMIKDAWPEAQISEWPGGLRLTGHTTPVDPTMWQPSETPPQFFRASFRAAQAVTCPYGKGMTPFFRFCSRLVSCAAAVATWAGVAAPTPSAAAMAAPVADVAAHTSPAVFEPTYAANSYHGSQPADSIHWVDRTATSRLVIVAPHAVWHHRGGVPKQPDLYTGGIAEAVGERLGASVLTVTGEVSDWQDRWEQRSDAFSQVLRSLPADSVVIDLHGMSDQHGVDVALGTAGRAHAPGVAAVVSAFQANEDGRTVDVDGVFAAKSAYTDTSFLASRGVTCVQVELSRSLRDGDAAESTVEWLAFVLSHL